MPIYRFAVTRAGDANTYDPPLELADRNAAWEEATIALAEVLKDIDGKLRQGGDLKMTVHEDNKHIYTLRVSSAVHGEPSFP